MHDRWERLKLESLTKQVRLASAADWADAAALVSAVPGNFALLLAADSNGVSVDQISLFADAIFRSRTENVSCWGPYCERVHDIIDETVVNNHVIGGLPERSVNTTWHTNERLSEAVFVLSIACPRTESDSIVDFRIVSIGNVVSRPEMIEAVRGVDSWR